MFNLLPRQQDMFKDNFFFSHLVVDYLHTRVNSMQSFVTSLARSLCFSYHWFVCPSVCLSVCLLATLLKNLWTDCDEILEGFGVVKETCNYILVAIWITRLTVQSEIRPLLSKLWADFDEIFWIALQWYEEQLMKFLGCSESPRNLGNMGLMTCLDQGVKHCLSALVLTLIVHCLPDRLQILCICVGPTIYI